MKGSLRYKLWILDDFFKDSKENVIGEVIGDCVAGKNKFEGLKADDIIMVKGDCIDECEQADWNELILYNYIHEAINGNLNEAKDVRHVLGDKLTSIEKYCIYYYSGKYSEDQEQAGAYITNINQYIDNAVEIVQCYVNALKLNEYLFQFRECKRKYDYEFRPTIKPKYAYRPSVMNISPNVDTKNSREDGQCFAHNFADLFFDPQSQLLRGYKVFLRYFNGRMYVSKLIIDEMDPYKAYPGKTIKYQYDTSDLDGLKKWGEWLWKRLDTLVKLPTPEIIKQWEQQWCGIF